MISLYHYHLPFSQPFVTAAGRYRDREGVLIRYLSNSADLWAEASPLPGFSRESFKNVSATLAGELNSINSFFTSEFNLSDLKAQLALWPSVPSIQFALSYLGLRVIAMRHRCSLDSFFPFNFSSTVQINDILGMNNPDEIDQQVRLSRKRGFKTFKCKVDQNPATVVKILKKLSAENPTIRFRVDANRSWPSSRLSELGSLFKLLPVEYVEEPSGYQSLTVLRKNISNLGLPVALDESVHSFDQLKAVKSTVPSIYVVIKPALYGSIFTMAETIFAIQSKRKKIIFSTLLESKIGREMTLFCAALMGDPTLAHGLNTGQLLRGDLQDDFDVRDGQIQTNDIFNGQGKPINFNLLTALNGIHL